MVYRYHFNFLFLTIVMRFSNGPFSCLMVSRAAWFVMFTCEVPRTWYLASYTWILRSNFAVNVQDLKADERQCSLVFADTFLTVAIVCGALEIICISLPLSLIIDPRRLNWLTTLRFWPPIFFLVEDPFSLFIMRYFCHIWRVILRKYP